MTQWPLFETYPALEAVLAPVRLAELPTPVQALPAFGAGAWTKRDDLTHPVYGGNKIRKLEFVLADMRRCRARSVITLGATGTNSGIAASMVSAAEGLPCTIITFPQPDSPTVEKNRAWMRHFNARFDARASLGRAVLRYYLHPARLLPGNYFLFAGCSNPVSVFAYINAAFELRAQIRAGQCPEPAEIIVPVSSNSTLAGLTLGMMLAGLSTRVTGVRVAPSHLGPFAACTPAAVEALMKNAMRILRASAPRGVPATLPPVQMTDAFFGDGYGVASAASQDAIERFARVGLPLENTYSGKAAAAFLDRLANSTGPVLFWNTFNSRELPDRAASGA